MMKTSFSIRQEFFMKAFHLLLFDESLIFLECILIIGLVLLLMIDSTFDKKKMIYLGYYKVVIYNYIFVGFNFVSNLIVFLFNHFPIFLWDLMERLSVRVW